MADGRRWVWGAVRCVGTPTLGCVAIETGRGRKRCPEVATHYVPAHPDNLYVCDRHARPFQVNP